MTWAITLKCFPMEALCKNLKERRKKMRKWRIVCSTDADNIDYEEVIASDDAPDFWTCNSIAESHDCKFFDVTEII